MCGITLVLVLNLLVAASYHLVVDDHTGTAQFGQDAVGQFAEAFTHVTNLLLTLVGILIHGEHAQDDVFILDVTGLHEFLETFPVFCRIATDDVGAHAFAEKLLVDIVFGRELTAVSQVIVEKQSALW